MAIQISGTTVIDNSRNISNVGSVTATSFFGSGANLTNIATFTSGTVMLFQQTSAPTGWTKSTTHNNKALRVVSGTASSGGSTAFTTVFTSRTPGGSVSGNNSGGGVNAHTLSVNEMPAHTHVRRVASGNGGGTTPAMRTLWANQSDDGSTDYIANNGGSASHNHGFSPPSWSGSFSGSAMDFAVQYVDVIFATKS